MSTDNYGLSGTWDHVDLRSNELKKDMVEKPPHYQVGGIETVDVIKAKLGGEKSEHWHGYLLGNIIKYTTRAKYKGKFLEDLQKARYYLNVLIEDSEK